MVDQGTVLITGVTGLIGSKVLEVFATGEGAGKFKVRATVRDKTNEKKMKPLRDRLGDAYESIEFVNADLCDEESIKAAVAGCTHIVHTASPVGMEPKNPDDMIIPAVNGTKFVMNAAVANGVKRVVVTSSVAAIMSQPQDATYPTTFTKEHWSTEAENKKNGAYGSSKTQAETAAWEISKAGGVELATILPSFTLGEFFCHTGLSSTAMIEQMANGKIPMMPKLMFPCVDVDDVAVSHFRALVVPEAAGQRFILSRETSIFTTEAGELVEKSLVTQGYKFKKPKEISSCCISCLACFCCCSHGVKSMKFFYGKVIRFDNSPARNILNIEFAKDETELIDVTCKTLIKIGALDMSKKKK